MIELTKQLAEAIISMDNGGWRELVSAAKSTMDKWVQVEDIQPGSYFRRKGRDFACLRLTDATAGFNGLNPKEYIYGVCYNGSITAVERSVLVEPVDFSVFQNNRLT